MKRILLMLIIWTLPVLAACMEDVVEPVDTDSESQDQTQDPMWDEQTQDPMWDDQDPMWDEDPMSEELDEQALEDMMQEPEVPEAPEDTSVAAEWHTVSIDYVWTDDDWNIFDTSKQDVAEEAGIYFEERQYMPIEFVLWAGQMIPGFEEAVIWMEEWEVKEVTLSPDEAYWEYDEDMIDAVPMQEFEQAWIEPVEWEFLDFWMAQWVVVEVLENEVMVDFNHPMAWQNMHFEIELHEIRAEDVSSEDLMTPWM